MLATTDWNEVPFAVGTRIGSPAPIWPASKTPVSTGSPKLSYSTAMTRGEKPLQTS